MPMREQSRIGALVDDAMRFIADNRERLIQAWIAETGCLPSESLLVEQRHPEKDGVIKMTVHVERKPAPAPEPSAPPAGVPQCKACGHRVHGELCRGGNGAMICACDAGRPLNPPPSDPVTVSTRERPSHCQCPYHNCAGKLENPDHELCELCYRRRGDECVTVATGGVPGGYRLGDGWLTTGIGMCRGGRHKDPDVRHEGTFVHDDGRGYCLEHAFQAGALVPIDTARSVPPGPLPPEGEPVLFTCQHGLTRSEPGCGAMCNLKPGSLWTGPPGTPEAVAVRVDPDVTADVVRAAVAAQAARVASFGDKAPGPVPVDASRSGAVGK